MHNNLFSVKSYGSGIGSLGLENCDSATSE